MLTNVEQGYTYLPITNATKFVATTCSFQICARRLDVSIKDAEYHEQVKDTFCNGSYPQTENTWYRLDVSIVDEYNGLDADRKQSQRTAHNTSSDPLGQTQARSQPTLRSVYGRTLQCTSSYPSSSTGTQSLKQASVR
jgi:hypothetical protein